MELKVMNVMRTDTMIQSFQTELRLNFSNVNYVWIPLRVCQFFLSIRGSLFMNDCLVVISRRVCGLWQTSQPDQPQYHEQ
jgi:hypothetical protein